MVDEPVDPEGMDNLGDSVDGTKQGMESLIDLVRKLNANLSKTGTDGSKAFQDLSDKQVTRLKKLLGDTEGQSLRVNKSLQDIKFDPDLSKMRGKFDKIASESSNMLNKLVNDIDEYAKKANKTTSGLADVAASSAAAALATGLAGMAEKFDAIAGPFEKKMTEVRKLALQSGIAFGESFNKAAGSTDALNAALVGVENNFLGTREQAIKVAEVLSKGMGTKGAIQGVVELSDAQGQFVQSLSTTEAAMAIGKATNIDGAEIAGKMALAYQELGETVDGSAKMFGIIQAANKESGIGFDKTMNSILAGASALKLWGGTVESVSPVFNAFSKSLKDSGIGRQGLTPELFQKFIGSLGEMNFETRALLGIQAGLGGGAGGALGAGLEMEAALEEGPEGMQKILGGLTDTLKNFGGGQVLTREEARENPELVRQFVQQREILKQILGVQDPAAANKMLEMISATEKTGLQMSGSMAKEFDNLVKQGKETAEQSTTTAEKAQKMQEAAMGKAAAPIVGHLKNMLRGTRFQRVMSGMRQDLQKVIQTGQPTVEATKQALGGTRGGGRRRQQRAGRRRPDASNIALPRAMKRAGVKRMATSAKSFGGVQFKPSAIHSPIVKKLNQSISVQKDMKRILADAKKEGGAGTRKGPIKVSNAMDKEFEKLVQEGRSTKPEVAATEEAPKMSMIEKLEAKIAQGKSYLDKTRTMRESAIKQDASAESMAKAGMAATGTAAPDVADAIDIAADTTKTVETQAAQDINKAVDQTKQEKAAAAPEEMAAEGGRSAAQTRGGGAGGGAPAPIEHTIKITAVLDNDTIKLDTSMLKDFITLGNA